MEFIDRIKSGFNKFRESKIFNFKGKSSSSKFKKIEKEIYTGNYSKAGELLKELESAPNVSVTERIRLNIFMSVVNTNLEDSQKGIEFADKAINISRQLNNNLLLTEALVAKASSYFDQNNLEECEKLVDECIKIFPTLSDQNLEETNEIKAKVHYLNGRVLRKKRDIENSIKEYETGLKLREGSSNLGGKAEIQAELGILFFMMGEAKPSVEHMVESIDNYEKIGNKPKVLKVYNNAGLIFQNIGDLPKAMELYQKALKISTELELKVSTAGILLNLGNIQASLGEVDIALSTLEEALKIYDELEMDAQTILNSMATIYEVKGNLVQALQLYNQSLEIAEKVQDAPIIGNLQNNIGSVHRLRGDLDLALTDFKKAYKIYEELGAPFELMMVALNILQTTIMQGNIKDSENYLKKAEEINETAKNPLVDQVFRLTRAHYLKSSRRIIKKAEAQLLFQQISEEDVLVHENTVEAMFNLCEMLIQELRQSGNEIIIDEVKEVLQKLTKIAEDQNSFKVLVESKLLQSKVALLELDLKFAQELLNEATQIAVERGLDHLAVVVSGEYDALLGQLSKWGDLIESNVSMIERLEMADLESMVSNMVRKRADEVPTELLGETPELFIILNDEGQRTYSQVFMEDTTLDDQMVGDLLTAVNSFLQETFSTEGSIDRLKHKDHIIMLRPVDKLLCVYVFKGQSLKASQKLEAFIERIKSEKDMYESVIASVEEVDNQEFNALVNNIFLEESVSQES